MMPTIRLLGRRLLLGLLTLWLVSLVLFALTQALPGDAARAILGREATPERLEAVRRQLHLDQSPVRQYAHWLGGAVRGDFGVSLAARQPVSRLLGDRLVNSLVLMGIAAVASTLLGVVAGTWSAMRRDRLVDHATSIVTLVLAAVPEFVLGVVLVVLLSTSVFNLFPAVTLATQGRAVWSRPDVLVLPVLTMTLAVVPYITRMLRGSMVEVLESEYVQMARLKGMPERTVIVRHALPNALGPVAQVIALQLAWLAGGVVVIEYLFRYPGIGAALVDSVANRDVPMVQAITLLIAALYVVVNLLADMVQLLGNAKVRTARA
jgi:peptide/nickel transport system permease protein